jgi:type VI secretion system protein ImpA
MEAELSELVALRAELQTLKAALAEIRETWVAKAGFEDAVSFDKLAPVAGKMFELVDGFVFKRDPSAAPRPATAEPAADASEQTPSTLDKVRSYLGGLVGGAKGESPSATAGSFAHMIASKRDAARALAAVGGYFAEFEPSAPALLLVRQAEQLMGKSFFEVIQVLMPARAEQAAIQIKGAQTFDLPLERLSALVNGDASSEAEAREDGEIEAEAASNGTGNGVNGSGTAFEARTRDEALALLLQVGDYYRAVEPSSPIPLLTERALSLVERDFLSLLKDLLPEESSAEE